MSIYMKISEITGNITAKNHENYIGLQTAEFSVNRSIKTNVGYINNRINGPATATEMLISKNLDISSPKLFLETCIGSKAKDPVEIIFCHNTNEPYLTYILHNVLFSGYFMDADDASIIEQLTLNFTAVESRYMNHTSVYNDVPSARPINLPASLHYYLVTPFMTLVPLTAKVNLLSYMGLSEKFNDNFDSKQISNMSANSVRAAGSVGSTAYLIKEAVTQMDSIILLQSIKNWRHKILKMMPKQGGVLIGAIYDLAKGESTNQLLLRGTYPADNGTDFKKLINIDHNKPAFTPTPLKGDSRIILYVWVTK